VAHSAIRFMAFAGVLATSLLFGGVGAATARADGEDAAGAAPETAAVTSKSDDNNSDSGTGPASNPEPPTSTFGNGREDVDVQSGNKNEVATPGTKKIKNAWPIPIIRIPLIPTLAEFLAAIQPQPPAPAPGPAFRTQEVAPPVVDSGGGASVAAVGGGHGGVDPLSIGVTAEPPVLQTPLVIAPLPIPLAAPRVAPEGPLGAAAGSSPPVVVAADVGAAGAPLPAIRGSLPPTVDPPAAAPAKAMSAPAARLDYYARELRNPTAGELALLALPGLAGLLLVTLSGGFIGYRQANSARLLRADAAARFLR
jgi:hypothetical protein